jgi:hypothetical protein
MVAGKRYLTQAQEGLFGVNQIPCTRTIVVHTSFEYPKGFLNKA